MASLEMELPKTMRAVVCHGPHDYRLEELPLPTIGPGEVLVRVLGVGICASDLKCYAGAPLFWGDEHREGYCQPPVVPGHEFVGRVVALGAGAAEKYGLALGDLAISEQIVPCWRCRFCKRGQYWMCQFGDVYGFRQRAVGAMAEYMRFPADALNYRVPERKTEAPAGLWQRVYARAGRVHRTAGVQHPCRAARLSRLRRHRGGGGLRAAGPGDGGGRPPQESRLPDRD